MTTRQIIGSIILIISISLFFLIAYLINHSKSAVWNFNHEYDKEWLWEIIPIALLIVAIFIFG